LHATLAARFSDAQCGFKAIRADRARTLLPLVQDTGWFFDTELLFLAERAGMRIAEVPVDWTDDPDSRVDIVATAVADLLGVARLVRGLVTGRPAPAPWRQGVEAERAEAGPAGLVGQLARFAAVGVASTVAYVALYVLLRHSAPAQAANAVALLATAVANTAVNRRVTFGLRSRAGRARHQFQGLAVFGVGLALTSGALAVLHGTAPAAGRATEVVVLVAANVVATVVRFVLFRSWVFHRAAPRAPAPVPPTPRSSR
jgi:putative flippase GtrA